MICPCWGAAGCVWSPPRLQHIPQEDRKVGLTAWQLLGSSFFTFLKTGMMFPISQPPWSLPGCCDFWNKVECGLATTAATDNPTGGDAAWWVPWTYTLSSSSSSGGLEPDLCLQLEGFHSLGPCLEVQGLKRCGKRDYHQKLTAIDLKIISQYLL